MRDSRIRRLIVVTFTAFLLWSAETPVASATVGIGHSWGQTVYVAAYSHIVAAQGGRKFPITSTLVVRNTDLESTISVTAVDYRDSQGGHLRQMMQEPTLLGPLASTEFALKESDETGGHSPSFIVRWEADEEVNAPVIEVLLIGKSGTHGLSFVGRAWVIEEASAPERDARPRVPTN